MPSENTPDILLKILKVKKQEITQRSRKRSLADLIRTSQESPTCRGFVRAIRDKQASGQVAVIAEIKKASPSKGVIRADFNPAQIARSYQQGGACCLSVLTDEQFFQGHDRYLQEAGKVVSLPLLRKEFIIDPYQIYEARAMGADCILLIVAALTQAQLSEFADIASQIDLDVLIEVHDEQELQRCLSVNTTLVGINNRNLRSFETRLQTTLDLLPHIPDDRIVVTESGIHSKADVLLMRQHGVNSFLVGESFMRADAPGDKLRELFL